MKKIVSAAIAAAMVAGSAFAEVSWAANARVYDDIFTYTAATPAQKKTDLNKKGTDDNGTVVWNKDTKHADDVTLTAKGENVGAKIVFNVTGAASGAATDVNVGTYQLWMNISKVRLDFGTFDTRLAKNINSDGNWGSNLSTAVKPGLFQLYPGANVGKDSTNVSAMNGGKTYNYIMGTYKVGNLSAYAGMWLTGAGWAGTITDTKQNHRLYGFPFSVGAKYGINKDTNVAAVFKLENITTGTGPTGVSNAIQAGTVYPTAFNAGYYLWSAAVDFSTKVAGWDAEATYTLASKSYDTAEKWYGHHISYYTHTATDRDGYSVADLNTYFHGFDLRAKGKLGDAITLTAIGNVTYAPATAHTINTTNEFGELTLSDYYSAGAFNSTSYVNALINQKLAYKDEDAYNADKGLSGSLAHYESLGVDYKFNDHVTFQVQFMHKNTSVYAVSTASENYVRTLNADLDSYTYNKRSAILAALTGVNSAYFAPKKELDPLKNSTFQVRPAVSYTVTKNCQLDLGVLFTLSGLSAVEKRAYEDTTKLVVSVPLCARVKL